ncbi:hypothetical protein GEMRC1_005557 [Eukaryota sp. GEM-RC1]
MTVAKKTTVASSISRFFGVPAQKAMERQFRHVRTVAVQSTLLARLFVLQHKHLAYWLTEHQYWYQCFDFVCLDPSSPTMPVREPFSEHTEVFNALLNSTDRPGWPFPPIGRDKPPCKERRCPINWAYSDLFSARALQLAAAFQQLMTDGLVSWKLNFFRTTATYCLCPSPKQYASLVLRGSEPPQSLLPWWTTWHHQIVDIFNNQVMDPERVDALLTTPMTDLTPSNVNFIFEVAFNLLLHLERVEPTRMRRQALTPMASYSPGFLPFSQATQKHFQNYNTRKVLLKNPHDVFRKKKFETYTISSDGVSLRFTFSMKPKKD